MGVAPPPTRREELAEFLRHLRERTAPEPLGVEVAGARRRTPGLRREEVSRLAGVGLSWYTWMEQGREITPSPNVLDALALVFDLSGAERRHLFDLAGVPVPAAADPCPTVAPGELADWIAALEPLPAYLANVRADVLAFNPAAERVILVPRPGPDGMRNMLWELFVRPPGRTAQLDAIARSYLARFRAAHARHYDDPAFRELIDRLLARSERFRELWPRHEVLDAQHGQKVVEHPRLGHLSLRILQSIPTNHPELRLTQYLPADDHTRQALLGAAEDRLR